MKIKQETKLEMNYFFIYLLDLLAKQRQIQKCWNKYIKILKIKEHFDNEYILNIFYLNLFYPY